jgi:hypothetical protein
MRYVEIYDPRGNASGARHIPWAAARWLSLAAAPTFAIMALLTGVSGSDMSGGGPLDMLCAAGHGGSLLSGMVPMYLLMSLFHASAWLKLIFGSKAKRAAADPVSAAESV